MFYIFISKDRTAFPLFLLYSGIKVQTEKGPVDAITRQAYFSLSEERLLRGSVEFNEMVRSIWWNACIVYETRC